MAEEYVGEEYVGEDDVLGAVRRAMQRPGGLQNLARRAQQRPFSKPPLPAQPTQGQTSKLRSYLGFGFLTWGPAEVADKQVIVEPQESFRGERLIIDQTDAGGASAGLLLLRRIDIGTMPQSPSVEAPAPASMFARDSTYAGLDLQIAYRGVKMQITLGITAAPGAGVTKTAAIGMFGEWVR